MLVQVLSPGPSCQSVCLTGGLWKNGWDLGVIWDDGSAGSEDEADSWDW